MLFILTFKRQFHRNFRSNQCVCRVGFQFHCTVIANCETTSKDSRELQIKTIVIANLCDNHKKYQCNHCPRPIAVFTALSLCFDDFILSLVRCTYQTKLGIHDYRKLDVAGHAPFYTIGAY